jgi:glutaredoxin
MKLATSSRTHRAVVLGLALLLSAAGASAQIYKSVDANGKVTFSDKPPANAAPVAVINAPGGVSTENLPYELAQAVRNAPVTLYTTAKCTPCDQGRSLLRGRGIPFVERTITTERDQDALKQAGGDGQLPMLAVGNKKSMGYESILWGQMLDYAAYPASRMLPPGYQYPAPRRKREPVAPPKQEEPPLVPGIQF